MKRFNFRLTSLLDFRKYLERLARKETAMAYKDVKDSQKAIEELKGRYIKTASELDTIVLKGIKAEELQLYNKYLDMVDSNIIEENQRKRELKKILDRKIAELTKKSVDKKVIERLKEKKEIEYMEEFRKFEQEAIDEVVLLKKARELNYESASKNQ
ncbi:MAG: flagellar export protein FliJ [Desulfobacteraceae bacterium]|nr:flagellar export protein FliJ [Desulfobacteraceae bacterium]